MERLSAWMRSDALAAVIGRGVGGTLSMRIAAIGAELALQLVLVRLLDLESFGIFVLVQSWIVLAVLPARFGLDQVMLRFVAQYRAAGQWRLLAGIVRRGRQTVAVLSLVVALLMASLVAALSGSMPAGMQGAFWVGCAALPLLALTGLNQGVLRGLRRVALAEIPEGVLVPLATGALALVAILAFGAPAGPETAMLAFVAAGALALASSAVAVRRHAPAAWRAATPAYDHALWRRTAVPMFLIALTQFAFRRTDIILVGLLVGAEAAGLYAVASRVATALGLGLVAAGPISASLISAAASTGRTAELQRTVTAAARFVLVITLPAALALVLLGKPILSLFGASFATGYAVLLIIVAAQLVSAFAGLVGRVTVMTGHQDAAARVYALATALNIVLDLTLIPALGIEGAAIATAAAIVFQNLALLHYVARRLGINPTAFARARRPARRRGPRR